MIRRRVQDKVAAAKAEAERKCTVEGWVLPKQESSWAPAGTWSNADLDVTPPDRRTWTSWTILGYWISDVISIQSWETGSSILAVGLSWREAIFSIVFGSTVMAVPMTLHGYAGSMTHVPFAVLARSAFGFHFAKFPVIVRLITCFFWHAITNYLGIGATTQVIRAIWPSYRNIPNHLPASANITTQEMISYFILWTIQFPLLTIPPYKMKWLFMIKSVMIIATILGMVIWVCTQVNGSGNIWDQQATVSGSQKAWMTMWALNSCTASWSTVGVNIPDFTRYIGSPKTSLSQGLWFPLICSWVAVIGIVVTSASITLYGKTLWDPISIVDTWDGPAGRAAAFFAGLSWALAQICVNISATVISGANDMTSLWPKYINIRRGAIILTVLGGWALVPWKIYNSASSLLNFMNSLGIFLAPIMGIQIADFYVVKRQAIDIPSLYQPHGRYAYWHGINWRALAAMAVAVGPTLPGLINAVNPNIDIGGGVYITNINWYYGFLSSFGIYSVLSLLFPAHESLVPRMVLASEEYIENGEDSLQAENKEEMERKREKGL
ncbi:hypothetical protein TMatcc_004940 [Talaromyces marneffei ATCC 18224]|uniref:Uracil permease, putative n=2 Tax=Talaromyces marneffei TaxID=37727 RepID=B6Q1A8_TALMQ|nr:uncharacterized protein EYB26_000142 [Talaromyces marneffei]EEA26771.1 uracil permease, putative [Talaromyces marneffei ATCC 18224]KAE8557486.1 hypothetical protein EYB25_002193 [Talaromyces marneffei]QGA12498.1 hypothetical protein EYB26_000142 [Talaromyces marneffei]